ncbi:MAG: LD-carboxypeptidase [Candidatus Amulumruptor caecigallinarius]|nr:LD-carboxypeptidase [Candidatus Amulumruptor caecigallinarius]
MNIAIISPATQVREEYIDGAARRLTEEGFGVKIMPHAKGPACGSYASSPEGRLQDLIAAFADPETDAILCARGGYGCNHLIDKISLDFIRCNPKPVIGFSDVTALHAMMYRAGVPSIHAPMAKHLTLEAPGHYCSRMLYNLLHSWEDGGAQTFEIPVASPLRPAGVELSLPPQHQRESFPTIEGVLVGGNLAVMNGLADTPFDFLRNSETTPLILFIEDISEAIYAVERMLVRMTLSGKLQNIKALIVGSFTDYKADRNYDSMYAMIRRQLSDIVPMILSFPVGHTPDNVPLIEGAYTRIKAEEGKIIFSQRAAK